MPYKIPAIVATFRGPTRSCHKPPITVPTPRNRMASVKLSWTEVSDQCWVFIRGILKTLQPYTAPRQICIRTAATAIPQRFGRRSEDIEFHLFKVALSLATSTPGLQFGRNTRYKNCCHSLLAGSRVRSQAV